MKKLFFIAAIAGAALVSCTKNELAPSATEQHEITFASPVTSTLTKADLVTGTVYPTDIPFYVFADYHKTEFTSAEDFTSYMTNGGQGVLVQHTGPEIDKEGVDDEETLDTYWTSDTKYYWPMDGYLTFYAYSFGRSDYSATLANHTYTPANGLSITGYTIKTDLSNQCDLMLSSRVKDQQKDDMAENNVIYDGVQIPFYHVLSAIQFAACTDKDYSEDDYTITLKSLTVKNAYTQANLKQFADAATDTPSNVWSNWGEEKNYTAFNGSWEVPVTTTTDTYTASVIQTSMDADLIVLPQALVHNTNEVIVEIVYTVSHPDMGTTGEGDEAVQNSIEYTKNFPLTVGDAENNKWLEGKRYIYSIIFGMEEIKFAPAIVEDWDDEGIEIEVPKDEIK